MTMHVETDADAVRAQAKIDFNLFCGLALPSVVHSPFPDFYLACQHILSQDSPIIEGKEIAVEGLLKFALGLPRGHAKTTFIKLLISYLIVHDQITFALIVCANDDLASNLLTDINRILSSSNITRLYGDWATGIRVDKAEKKEVHYRGRQVTLVASGWKSGIRGMNIDNQRPDFILCDDAQTRENAESESDSKRFFREMTGTVFKAIAPTGFRRIVYVGNMYPANCFLAALRTDKTWLSMVTGAILSNGKPLWPALHSLKSLGASLESDMALGQAAVWYAEVMNDPVASELTLLPEPIPDSPIAYGLDSDGIVSYDGAVVIIDPANFKKQSDDNVIVGAKKFDGKLYAVSHVRGILDPAEVCRKAIAMALELGGNLILIEDAGYQSTLGFWMNEIMRDLHLDEIHIDFVKPAGRSKESRIRLSVQAIYSKETIIHCPSLRRDYTWQGSQYRLGTDKNKDDLLDAVAYLEDARNHHMSKIGLMLPRDSILATYNVVDDNLPF